MSALDLREQPPSYHLQQRKARLDAAEEEQRRKIIQEETALRIAEESAQRAAAEEQRRAAEQDTKSQFALSQQDIVASMMGEKEAQKPWHETPEHIRARFIGQQPYNPEVTTTIPKRWNESLPTVTGKIPGIDGMEEAAVQVTQDGSITRQYARPKPQEGRVYPSLEAIEEDGISTEGAIPLPSGGYRVEKVARNDISRRKLGVNEKNALTGAVTAAASLDNIEKEFDVLEKKGKTGPIVGRFNEAKQAIGYGDEDFSAFNAQTSGNLFNLARSLQGAGVLTEQDILRMEKIVPTGKMDKAQFRGQMAGIRSLMAEKIKAWKIVNDESLAPEQREQVDSILTRIETGAAKDPNRKPINPPAGKTPAAPAKPKTVRQNGVTYTLQPDGTYK